MQLQQSNRRSFLQDYTKFLFYNSGNKSKLTKFSSRFCFQECSSVDTDRSFVSRGGKEFSKSLKKIHKIWKYLKPNTFNKTFCSTDAVSKNMPEKNYPKMPKRNQKKSKKNCKIETSVKKVFSLTNLFRTRGIQFGQACLEVFAENWEIIWLMFELGRIF